MNILQVKKYYLLIKKESQNKLSLLILIQEKHLKNKQTKKTVEENKKQLYNKQPGDNELFLSKEREIFKNIYNKRLDKIHQLSKTIDYGDLKKVVVLVVAQEPILVN